MRICYHCGRITSGQPLFCSWCSRSYDIRLCPRLHPNPRTAQACSQCGSQNLSTPQEKFPFWFKPLLFFATALPGLALLTLSLGYMGYFLICLLRNPSDLFSPMLFGLLLGILWLAWMLVPYFIVAVLRRRRKKTKGSRY